METNSVKINGKEVKNFNLKPEEAMELYDVLKAITERTEKTCQVYVFSQDELDTIYCATDSLLEEPTFKGEFKTTIAAKLTDAELRAVLCVVANADLSVKRGDYDDSGVSDRGEPCIGIEIHLEKEAYETAVSAYKKVKHLIVKG